MKNREQLQIEAGNAFANAGIGTICLDTGAGKSKVAIDFIRNNSHVNNILITSPRTNLKKNWYDELVKWGLEPWRDGMWQLTFDTKKESRTLHIEMENIQTTYKWKNKKYDLIILDEIHTIMTPEFSRLMDNNEYTYLLGLSATHDITKNNDKQLFYDKYCPVIYEYYDSADDGLINKTRFLVVNHYLNNEDRIIVSTKKDTFEKGELEHYEYLTTRIKKGQEMMMGQNSTDWFKDAGNWFWKGRGTREQKFAAMMYLNAIRARKDFLLKLPSTARLAKKISGGIRAEFPKAKVLVFSELTAQADKISKYTVHSNNTDKQNANFIEDFNGGHISELGSCNSLTLGLNLKGATHAVMESYIGSATRSKQKKGRLDRLSTDDVADMWIIKVIGTQSEKWFNNMTKKFDLSEAIYISGDFILRDDFDYRKAEVKTRVVTSHAGTND